MREFQHFFPLMKSTFAEEKWGARGGGGGAGETDIKVAFLKQKSTVS